MPEYTGSFSATNQNTTIVSAMSYIDKPQVFHKLVGRYPDQFELGWLKEFGMFEKTRTNQPYIWHENNKFMDAPFIASFAQIGATNGIRITLAAASHQDSGTKSSPRKGLIVQLTNGYEGRINAKSEAVAGAHTIDIVPIKNSISYATFSAGIVAGTQFIYTGNVWTEGSVGQDKTIIATTSVMSNRIQYFTDTAQVTFDSKTNQTWIPFTNPLTGQTEDALYIKTLYETEKRFMFAEENALFLGTASETGLVDEDGNALYTTEGMIPTLDRSATQQTHNGTINQAFYDEAIRKMRKNECGNDYLLLMGLNVSQANTAFLADFGKAGSIVYANSAGEKAIDVSFSSFKYGSYTIKYKDLNALSKPEGAGTAGFGYADRAIFMPNPSTSKFRDEKQGIDIGPFTVMYKERYDKGARDGGKFSMQETGWNASNGATSKADVQEWSFKSNKGARTAAAAHFINVRKTS